MWEALPTLIKNDPYLTGWNATIFGNASDYYSADPVAYVMDGDSGILDNAREVKMRIKAFCYVYRMTNDTKWADRAWMEVQVSNSFLSASSFLTHTFRMLLGMARLPLVQMKTSGTMPISWIQQNLLLHSPLPTTGSLMFSPMSKRARYGTR